MLILLNSKIKSIINTIELKLTQTKVTRAQVRNFKLTIRLLKQQKAVTIHQININQ